MRLFYLVLVVFYLDLAHANSQGQCPPQSELIYQIEDFCAVWNEIEESPFMVACQKPKGLLKDRPETSLLKRSVIIEDAKGNSSKDFFRKVIAKIKLRIQAARTETEDIQNCLKSVSTHCSKANKWISKDLPEYLAGARWNLALSQSLDQFKTLVGKASDLINYELEPLGGYKLVPWSELTKTELVATKNQFRQYRKQAKADAAAQVGAGKLDPKKTDIFINDALLKVRYEHFLAYEMAISKMPILQYFKGPEVSKMELEAALSSMTRNLKAEEAELTRLEGFIDQRTRGGHEPVSLLSLLNYSSAVEEVLLENPELCGIGASLVFTSSNRQLGNSIAVGLPIMAASFFAPPLLSYFGGAVAVGSVGLYQNYSDFKSAQRTALSYLMGDPLESDYTTLNKANADLKYETIMLPVGVALRGMLSRPFRVGVVAFASRVASVLK